VLGVTATLRVADLPRHPYAVRMFVQHRRQLMPDGRTYPHLDGPLTADAVVGLYRVEGAEAVDAMLPRHGAKAPAVSSPP
jgi:hypothetical protein